MPIREENGTKFQKGVNLSLEEKRKHSGLQKRFNYPEWLLKEPNQAAGVFCLWTFRCSVFSFMCRALKKASLVSYRWETSRVSTQKLLFYTSLEAFPANGEIGGDQMSLILGSQLQP